MNLPSSEDAPGLFEEDQELLASVTAEDIQLVLDSVQQSSLPTNADSLATIPPPPAPPPAPPLSYPPIPFDPPFPSVPPQFSDMPLLFAYPALTPLAEQSKLSLAVNPFDQWNNLPSTQTTLATKMNTDDAYRTSYVDQTCDTSYSTNTDIIQ